jgi:hypothetical protein
VCAGVDSADHWIRHCPLAALQQHRADCMQSFTEYLGKIKITAVARVLQKILELAVHDREGYRIWTANWTARCQRLLSELISQACRVVTPATLRKHIVVISEFFITAVTRLWLAKSAQPLHPAISARLSGDMSSHAHLYSQSRNKFGTVTTTASRPRRRVQARGASASSRSTRVAAAPRKITHYFSSSSNRVRTLPPSEPQAAPPVYFDYG